MFDGWVVGDCSDFGGVVWIGGVIGVLEVMGEVLYVGVGL